VKSAEKNSRKISIVTKFDRKFEKKKLMKPSLKCLASVFSDTRSDQLSEVENTSGK
jgi:hypothetical protein